MPQTITAFVSGLLFGLGLVVSSMIDPAKVLGFLDLFGNWDPSLAFVMGGGVAVAAIGYAIARRRGAPVYGACLHVPTNTTIDARLIGGSALFGLGWGLVGFCPGPAISALTFGRFDVTVFVASMVGGMALYRFLVAQPAAKAAPAR